MPEHAEMTARITELEQDNARLRRLLSQGGAPGELRHRLRSTLALLRGIIRRSAESGRDLAGYIDHLLDRLEAVTRAQAAADQHGEVRLHMLLADELLVYGLSEGERLTLSGPEVQLAPRAGQVVALALHELAVNALEHGALGGGNGRLEVSWTAGEAGTPLVLRWNETGIPNPARPARTGFGMEVLNRMLPHELGAETVMAPRPDGVRWTISLPLPAHVGRIDPGG